MAYVYSLASKEAERVANENKENYDQKVKFAKLEIGNRVLVRKVGNKENTSWLTSRNLETTLYGVFKIKTSLCLE